MAGRGGAGDWLLVEELFERGEPAFVDALRAFDDADVLAQFAARWVADRRPEARQRLFEYLDRPLNAYRHEGLVKRAFKRAEAAGDDELMGKFLVAFDRSVRRVHLRRSHYESRDFATEGEANQLAVAWKALGLEPVRVWPNWQRRYHVWGRWIEPYVGSAKRTVMPRGALKPAHDYRTWNPATRTYRTYLVPDWVHVFLLDSSRFEKDHTVPPEVRKLLRMRRLFSLATRDYLRRRAWRYFRRLGRTNPERYVAAVVPALLGYRDADMSDGLALLDNWGLMHILFHHSPCLTRNDRAFQVAEGHTLGELEPAPMFATLWAEAPRALVDLLVQARCRPVRGWALGMIRRDLAAVAEVFPLEERLALLGHDDSEVVALAADLLRGDPALVGVPVARWLSLVETASPSALGVLTEVMESLIAPERVTLAEAVKLAAARPLPVARLGQRWLTTKIPTGAAECRLLLGLAEAESDALRPELIRWAATVLAASPEAQPEWVLEWLDSRHEDVRRAAWTWFLSDGRTRDDVMLWRRLLESPHDDIRSALVAELDARTRGPGLERAARGDLDADLLGLLWAAVLLNVRRGSRAKPLAVRQILARLEARPAELPRLLPLLAVALRSHRGPEWRAGLAAVVRLADNDPAAAALVRQTFPELQWTGPAA